MWGGLHGRVCCHFATGAGTYRHRQQTGDDMQQQATTIAELEQYIADHSDATAEELGL